MQSPWTIYPACVQICKGIHQLHPTAYCGLMQADYQHTDPESTENLGIGTRKYMCIHLSE